jgi:nicotinamidase-related amidase
MTVTTLDPKTALVVIDLQKGIVSRPTVHPVAEVVKHASALAAAFRRHGLPVVLVNVAGVASGRTEQARSRGGITRIFPRLGETGTTQEITDLLDSTR